MNRFITARWGGLHHILKSVSMENQTSWPNLTLAKTRLGAFAGISSPVRLFELVVALLESSGTAQSGHGSRSPPPWNTSTRPGRIHLGVNSLADRLRRSARRFPLAGLLHRIRFGRTVSPGRSIHGNASPTFGVSRSGPLPSYAERRGPGLLSADRVPPGAGE
jgi:hypothetical protein